MATKAELTTVVANQTRELLEARERIRVLEGDCHEYAQRLTIRDEQIHRMSKTPHGIVETICRFLNQMGWDTKAVVLAMAQEHRTLQQQFTMLCLAWLWHMAHTSAVDGRNQYSADIAKRIVANTPLEEFDVRVPFI